MYKTKLCTQLCTECINLVQFSMCYLRYTLTTRKVGILKMFLSKKKVMQRDLQDLEKSIYIIYQEAAISTQAQRVNINRRSQKLTSALDKQGEALHTEIDTIIQGMKSEIDDMDAQHIAAIDEHEDKISKTSTEMAQIILDLKKLLDTSDVGIVSVYASRIEEFRSLPAQF